LRLPRGDGWSYLLPPSSKFGRVATLDLQPSFGTLNLIAPCLIQASPEITLEIGEYLRDIGMQGLEQDVQLGSNHEMERRTSDVVLPRLYPA
jgi:hypothetical protein